MIYEKRTGLELKKLSACAHSQYFWAQILYTTSFQQSKASDFKAAFLPTAVGDSQTPFRVKNFHGVNHPVYME